jgi:hypothetical protein
MLPCYVFVHPDFVFYVSLLSYKRNIKYKILMDKHITVKHKIQNMDGQTHNRETLKT